MIRALLATAALGLAGLSLTACDPGDVVTLPSGCVRIRPDVSGQADWVWYPQPFNSDAETIYAIDPDPDQFVGVQMIPHATYIYNAPIGANQWQRAVNCAFSDGASQG